MSNSRVIGWSEEGWPILHPEDIAKAGDPVDESYNEDRKDFAEKVFGKVEAPPAQDNS